MWTEIKKGYLDEHFSIWIVQMKNLLMLRKLALVKKTDSK